MPKDSAGQDHAAAYEPLVPEDTVYTEGAPAEEEPVPSRTARRRERAVDTVPAEPEVMADTEKYQLTPIGRRRRIATIFHIARKYEVWNNITPVRLRCMLEELGPMFVKMGQILANRSEILPQRFCDELRRLRTEVDPVPYRVVLECLEAEYGHKLGEIFDAVDPNPLGSASLAQVHRARLVTGEDVAIKVQRPGAQQVMAQDIDIMRSLVRHISRFVKTDQFIDLHDVVEELWQSFREETNFLMEARNLDEFYAYHASTPGVSCPRSYLDLCTEHVVVMDYIEGISIAEPDELVGAGYELRDVGERIVDDYATQVLDHGFFHADPHAGNIILRDGVIYFIDLGMVGRMSSHDRRLVKDIVFAVAENDVPKLKDSLMRFAVTRGNNSEIDHTSFLSDLDFIVEDFGSLDLRDLDIGKFLTALINLARKNDVELPSVVTMFARGTVTLEGLLTEYLPDVNMIEIITAHIKREKSSYARARELAGDLARSSVRATKGTLEAAEHLGLASRMLTRGQLKLNTEVIGSEEVLRRVGTIVDRLSMSMVIAGLFIGSSVVYYARIEPVIFGIPVIGFLGYLAALVLALMLGREIWRNSHGKHR
ncbi:ABC1 kinase family protein [Collinsella intestinalis]|uniref:ABC1 kinase family protein n=1 Tax=Collinsella intestinalis TaxID=147207 RepID=UPI0025A3C848|nr:AarF/UbiB family protein [Collinsella intestinalis]MDM8163119.1 AarF/UbiB family protein [Collinsella intestinalis]